MNKMSSTIQFIYFKDYENSCKFFTDLLGLEVIPQTDWCTIWKVTDTSFIGGVDAVKRERNYWAENKCGLFSFNVPNTDMLAEIHKNLCNAGYEPTELRIGNQGGVDGLSGFWVVGPEGWSFEFETFGKGKDREVFHPELVD